MLLVCWCLSSCVFWLMVELVSSTHTHPVPCAATHTNNISPYHKTHHHHHHQALVFVYLSWTDPRARQTVEDNRLKLAANSSESCKLQCQLYPENQPKPVKGCCDDVWVSIAIAKGERS